MLLPRGLAVESRVEVVSPDGAVSEPDDLRITPLRIFTPEGAAIPIRSFEVFVPPPDPDFPESDPSHEPLYPLIRIVTGEPIPPDSATFDRAKAAEVHSRCVGRISFEERELGWSAANQRYFPKEPGTRELSDVLLLGDLAQATSAEYSREEAIDGLALEEVRIKRRSAEDVLSLDLRLGVHATGAERPVTAKVAILDGDRVIERGVTKKSVLPAGELHWIDLTIPLDRRRFVEVTRTELGLVHILLVVDDP